MWRVRGLVSLACQRGCECVCRLGAFVSGVSMPPPSAHKYSQIQHKVLNTVLHEEAEGKNTLLKGELTVVAHVAERRQYHFHWRPWREG